MKQRKILSLITITLGIQLCVADINIHNPRGSNNRLNENTRNRKNNNRLFDSQNNDRGGHNVGEKQMYYYSGTNLQIQWANQHSCGDQNNNCEVILQYMCHDLVRDGLISSTPPSNAALCRNKNCETDIRFGRHEPIQYFKECSARQRNKGLFTANQKVRQSARSTRQNPTGNRNGYECAEEKDYYPYWGPTPWKDIAVFTNNPERCDYYRRESQNVKSKFHCVFGKDYWNKRIKSQIVLFPDRKKCVESVVHIGNDTYRGRWVSHRSHGLPPPECLKNQWSRDNHQGNTIGGEFMKYDWKLPDIDDQNCVLRMRYNVSTNDFDSWAVNSSHNDDDQPDVIWKRFNLTQKEARMRQYIYRRNPNVDVFGTFRMEKKFRLTLAINTAQYGRTFQDRTHSFKIVNRPKSLRRETIHNINVRGKRGNIVQVFPSVEYDFVPNKLYMNEGEYVHFQWTGANTNPVSDDGRGQGQTDRSNIVQLIPRSFQKGFETSNGNLSLATNYPLEMSNFLGFDWKKTENLAFLERCSGYDPLLDAKSAYFDMPPEQIHRRGKYHYMSTRNNNFSNRNQKASILVGETSYSPRNKGAWYRGFEKVTSAGIRCQRWDQQFPHQHKYDPKVFWFLGVEENFCRNPNRKEMPWCFTTDPNIRWQYCNIPPYSEQVFRMQRGIIQNDEEIVDLPDTDEDIPLEDE